MLLLNITIIACLFFWVLMFGVSLYQDRQDNIGWKMYFKEKKYSDIIYKENTELKKELKKLKDEKG